MNVYDTIANRRSIRKFKLDDVPRALVERVLQAAALAPSAKNRQPWRFTVATGDAKQEMLTAMKAGLENEESPLTKLPEGRQILAGAKYTLRVMKQAPCTVFITNPGISSFAIAENMNAHFYQLADTQSVGAAIQNLCLAATAEGLGSLWICDIFFAYPELCAWLGTEGQLVAAVSLGWPDQAPPARPRLPLEAITDWRE